MIKQCVHQRLDDDLNWVCPRDANCEELECRGVWDKREKDGISYCKSCNCMTKTVAGKCGKCGEEK